MCTYVTTPQIPCRNNLYHPLQRLNLLGCQVLVFAAIFGLKLELLEVALQGRHLLLVLHPVSNCPYKVQALSHIKHAAHIAFPRCLRTNSSMS